MPTPCNRLRDFFSQAAKLVADIATTPKLIGPVTYTPPLRSRSYCGPAGGTAKILGLQWQLLGINREKL